LPALYLANTSRRSALPAYEPRGQGVYEVVLVMLIRPIAVVVHRNGQEVRSVSLSYLGRVQLTRRDMIAARRCDQWLAADVAK